MGFSVKTVNCFLRWVFYILVCSYPLTLLIGFLQKHKIQLPSNFAAEVGFWGPGGHCTGSKVSFLGRVLSWVGCSILQWNLLPVQLSCVQEQMLSCSCNRLQACPPPLPSLDSGGQQNTSSAHSAPLCACATESVSCNDMSAHLHPILSLTCAYYSTLIRHDYQDRILKCQRVKSGPLPTGSLVP